MIEFRYYLLCSFVLCMFIQYLIVFFVSLVTPTEDPI